MAAHSSDGQVCSARVTELLVASGTTPHFGFYQDENGNPRTVDNAELIEEAWSEGAYRLVGALQFLECKDKSIAVVTDKATPPKWLATGIESKTYNKEALTAFKSLREYKAAQKEFAGYGHKGAWTAYDGAAPSVREFTASGQTYVSVRAKSGSGCGDFFGDLLVVWRVNKSGQLDKVLLTYADDFASPKAIVDMKGDGNLGLILSGAALLKRGKNPEVIQKLEFPYYDCPC